VLHPIGVGLTLNDAGGDTAIASFYCANRRLELLAYDHSLHQLSQPVKLLIKGLV
jgi:hypothetical protein